MRGINNKKEYTMYRMIEGKRGRKMRGIDNKKN